MQELRANTEVDVRIGPFVDVGDGFTPETGINLGAADEAELLKHNGAATVDISGNGWAAIAGCDGWYDLTLTTTDINTEGMLTVVVQDDSVCLPVFAHFMVLSEAAYDSKYVAKDDGFMDVNIKTIGRSDTQETEADNLESACANYSGARGLAGTALPDAAADAAGGLPISDAGGLDLDTMDSNVSAILTDTGTEGVVLADDAITSAKYDESTAFPVTSADTGATRIARAGADSDTLETLSDQIDSVATEANIETHVQNVVETNKLDHLVAVAESDDPVDNSIVAKLSSSDGDWSGYDNTTDSLEAIRDKQADMITAGDVWSEQMSDNLSTGSMGEAMRDIKWGSK